MRLTGGWGPLILPSEPKRADPDALLAEAKRAGRGRLKVYLGMSPGVGKTFEMLSAAKRKQDAGVDVAVGLVETHGRKDTEALLAGLEVLPRQPIEHRGRTLLEFDIDGALARRPGLLLVDEYAHSNAPTSRHPKRWQDVEEILEAGIDVWTTLNVQHLESLVDVVWRITGVRQRETVPDSALSAADEIEVVDITPGELRERLAEGKVYMPDTATLAADRFFKVENLTALRELALRRAAQTVDDKLVGHLRRAGIEGPWDAGERILVLIGPDAMASTLVRAGRRLADMLDAPWTVVHVERPNRPAPDAASGQRVGEALRLATQLGGGVVTLTGDDLVASVLDYASRNNVTQIVIGRGVRTRVRALFGRALPQALLEGAKGWALHIITDAPADAPPPAVVSRARAGVRPWLGYAVGLALIGAANGVAALADRFTTGANLAMVFLVAVLATGLGYGLWPAVASAALGALTYNFFFLEPRFTIYIGHAADVFTFAVFFAVALTTGSLAGRVRDQARNAARRATAVSTLLTASRSLSSVATRSAAASALAEQASAAASTPVVVFLPESGDIRIAAAHPSEPVLDAGALTAARWAWERGEPAGAGTGTLPQIDWTFYPLRGLKDRAGVAGVGSANLVNGPEGERLLLALLDQGAVAIERAELAGAQVENETLRRSDRLRAALMNSISHDLRTPLSTVLGATTTLIDYGKTLQPAVRADLLQSIREEAERLNRYVGDLLDMTRIEGGALQPKADWTDVRDVLDAALGRVSRRAASHSFHRDFPGELSSVKADPGLLEQALVNIIENAVAYSPENTPVEVAAYEDRHNVVISIEDEGPGIPVTDLESVFDKFRRLGKTGDRGKSGDSVKGVGLGLSISKGFVEAMGGRIAVASPIHPAIEGGARGTRVLISLPKAIATPRDLL